MWAIALHGGAGTIDTNAPPELVAAYRASLRAALEQGRSMLAGGASALDTVEQVARTLEDDPLFNAGRGGALNEQGVVELDAAIMDGATLRSGAVAATRTVKNPVSLARLVMERTRHVLLVGEGADQFASAMGVPREGPDYFITPRRRQLLEQELRERTKASASGRSADGHARMPVGGLEPSGVHPGIERSADSTQARTGTIGVVALDQQGRLAAATSTGGVTGKLPGRVGDAPLIGAGTLADDLVAISGTGTGEKFIRHGVARSVAARMRLLSKPLAEATHHLVFNTLDPDDGGLIAVDRRGNIAMPFSTIGMYRGAADSNGRFEVAIWNEP
ncbi:MAG: isoaspartyl peptidase/L-asparaginase [Planctomycetota bacterium]|nr:isoaspartyl peptidase/L-asparaginase [Planctomycetota bacterium]